MSGIGHQVIGFGLSLALVFCELPQIIHLVLVERDIGIASGSTLKWHQMWMAVVLIFKLCVESIWHHLRIIEIFLALPFRGVSLQIVLHDGWSNLLMKLIDHLLLALLYLLKTIRSHIADLTVATALVLLSHVVLWYFSLVLVSLIKVHGIYNSRVWVGYLQVLVVSQESNNEHSYEQA